MFGGLLKNYSNRNWATRQLNDLIAKAISSSVTRKPVATSKRVKKLTKEQVNELCSLYEGGSSTYSLAKVFGIRRDRVSIILKRADTLRELLERQWFERRD